MLQPQVVEKRGDWKDIFLVPFNFSHTESFVAAGFYRVMGITIECCVTIRRCFMRSGISIRTQNYPFWLSRKIPWPAKQRDYWKNVHRVLRFRLLKILLLIFHIYGLILFSLFLKKSLEEKLGSSYGPVLRAENRSWVGLGQRQWADFLKNFPLRNFWHVSCKNYTQMNLKIWTFSDRKRKCS